MENFQKKVAILVDSIKKGNIEEYLILPSPLVGGILMNFLPSEGEEIQSLFICSSYEESRRVIDEAWKQVSLNV